MVDKKPTKNLEFKGGVLRPLTKIQAEVLRLLSEEFLTIEQVASRRGTSRAAIYSVLENLKKKGAIGRGLTKILTKGNAPLHQGLQNPDNRIRLHGQEFNIQLIFATERYLKLREQANQIIIDGNVIRLYASSVEIYSAEDRSFFGKDAHGAFSGSLMYWQKFFQRIEHELGIEILRSRYRNVKQVKAHYAEINNELAGHAIKNKQSVQIKGDDGITWLLIDDSWNLKEAETVHPQDSKQDMQETFGPYMNDLRSFQKRGEPVPLMSELMLLMRDQLAINKETAAGLNAVVQLMKPQQSVEPENSGIVRRPDYIG